MSRLHIEYWMSEVYTKVNAVIKNKQSVQFLEKLDLLDVNTEKKPLMEENII